MERRFVVEAKEFLFLVRLGFSVLHLEEKRKSFLGWWFWARCVLLGWWTW